MLDTKQFISAMKQIAEEKGIAEEKVLDTIQLAIAAAYKKDFGEKGQDIRAKLDPETGNVGITQIKTVIEGTDEEGYITGPTDFLKTQEEGAGEESRLKFNPEKHITLEEVKKLKKKLALGEELVIELESKTEFGRIAAQTAKQVVIQRLREIEREAIMAEFKGREGEVISGIIQRNEGRMIYVDLGRTNGLLPPPEQVERENYRIGARMRLYIVRVEETNRGPAIILSRSHPKFLMRLFAFEVPEIESGSVEIKAIAREAGSRSKIAVVSHEDGVDPIGSLVGQKGVRVQTVINELGGEKIDIIEWNDDPQRFIAHALAPAKILAVKVIDEAAKHAVVEVAEDQFSLAIGKRGQNVRLAAKLSGWRIDVRGPEGQITAEEALAEKPA
ncbi:MAG: transcription termination factor NusA [Patescibacteria group bacterium]